MSSAAVAASRNSENHARKAKTRSRRQGPSMLHTKRKMKAKANLKKNEDDKLEHKTNDEDGDDNALDLSSATMEAVSTAAVAVVATDEKDNDDRDDDHDDDDDEGKEGKERKEEKEERKEEEDGGESEGEGEALIHENMAEDYKSIPELDSYDPRLLDDGEYDEVTYEQRLAAEQNIRKREFEAAMRNGRTPMALLDASDGDSALPVHKHRRIHDQGDIYGSHESAASEDIGTDGSDTEVDANGSYVDINEIKNPKESLEFEQIRRKVKRRFKAFLINFKNENNVNLYLQEIKNMCESNKQSLDVNYMHLSQELPTIGSWLGQEPERMLSILNEVALKVVLEIYPHYLHLHKEIFVRISKLPIVDKIRDLRNTHLNGLVKIEGVVTRRSSVFPQIKLVRYNCGKCRWLSLSYETEARPKICLECQSKGPFIFNSSETLFNNYQKITIQETPGSVPEGGIPRQKVTVGNEVEVTGIYKCSYEPALNWSNGFPVFSTNIHANRICSKTDVIDAFYLTDEDEREIRRLSSEPNIAEKIINSIAPSIHGHRIVKTALALTLFGGVAKEFENKHRLRGDINLLVLGDPGTAKSQLLKYAEKMSDRAIYTTGKGASAVGLTASVHLDPLTREWTLQGGALVLADRGLCMIDEFDKMSDQDRTSIHEAMEQQSISISKAGIISTLKARCAVIAAANPINGRYNSSMSFAENVNLSDPILSRFDVLCVVRDEVNMEEDRHLAQFIIKSHQKAHPNFNPVIYQTESSLRTQESKTDGKRSDGGFPSSATTGTSSAATGTNGSSSEDLDEKFIDEKQQVRQSLLKKYIIYARKHIHPKLHNFDVDKVTKLYAEMRRESNLGSLVIAPRHLESIIRMSEAHAKMHLRHSVSDDDINVAIQVMLETFIGAQKFSLKPALQKHFNKYMNYKRDTFELLLHQLKTLVEEKRTFQVAQRGSPSVLEEKSEHKWKGPEEVIEIPIDMFAAKALEVNIVDVTPFFRSHTFVDGGFTIDNGRKLIMLPA